MSGPDEILVIGTFRLSKSDRSEALAEMERMIAASRAEAGCLAYHYAFDMIDTGLVHVIERWQDRAALDAHFASGHLAHWRAQFDRLGITSRSLVALGARGAEPV